MSSRGINKVILIGNLGHDPEVRYMTKGGAVANLTVATSENWRDKATGEKKEKTEWHRVVLFGKLAEVASEYLRKGAQVYIEGALQTRKWTDQSGVEKYMTEVVVNVGGTMQMLSGRKMETTPADVPHTTWGSSHNAQSSNNVFDTIQNARTAHSSSPVSSNNESPIEFEDDIPF